MYIREIHIENIRGFRSGNRSVRLDLTRPDGTLAGWTVFAGRNGEDKSTLLRSIALSIIGPRGSTALQDSFANWLHQGATRGLTRTHLVPSEGDSFNANAPPKRGAFWSGLEWQPLSDTTEAFASPAESELAASGPWDE